jgi:hypothetical protein
MAACGGVTDNAESRAATGGSPSSSGGVTSGGEASAGTLGGTASGGNVAEPGAGGDIATSGGTTSVYQGGTTYLTPTQYSALTTSAACSSQTTVVGACVFPVPPDALGPNGAVGAILVIRLVNGSTSDPVLINRAEPTCPGGEGWYADDSGQVALCDATCNNLHLDMTPTIEVLSRCFAKE